MNLLWFSKSPKSYLQIGHNHHINLENGSQLVNLRPYRYPYVQKEKIEKIVQDMLKSGVIQPNNSPYAFPVFLVLMPSQYLWSLCLPSTFGKET